MKIERMDDGSTPNYSRERIHLSRGESHDCAGSTKKKWHGPGFFERVTFPDGAREDHAIENPREGGARIGY